MLHISNIIKNFQFKRSAGGKTETNSKGERAGLQRDYNEAKSYNTLNQETYQKKIIMYYGYKYEEPTKIYAVDYKDFREGENLAIKVVSATGGLKTVTAKSESHLKSSQNQNFESKSDLKQANVEFDDEDEETSPVKSTKNRDQEYLNDGARVPASKSLGKISDSHNKIEVRQSGRTGRRQAVKPISVEKARILEDRAESQEPSDQEEAPNQKVAPSKTVKINPSVHIRTIPSAVVEAVVPACPSIQSEHESVSRTRQRRNRRLKEEPSQSPSNASMKSGSLS